MANPRAGFAQTDPTSRCRLDQQYARGARINDAKYPIHYCQNRVSTSIPLEIFQFLLRINVVIILIYERSMYGEPRFGYGVSSDPPTSATRIMAPHGLAGIEGPGA
jgi:hypothetical protein